MIGHEKETLGISLVDTQGYGQSAVMMDHDHFKDPCIIVLLYSIASKESFLGIQYLK
jgi:hypothetical protein